jgi:hypothetical protein
MISYPRRFQPRSEVVMKKQSSEHACLGTSHPYARISKPEQRKGGGLERQTQADMEEFCRRFGFNLSPRVRIDDGVSAWKGLNATPNHELGKFLREVRAGDIPAGDCLLLENYDRFSRQNPWAAISLLNDLRELRIHVGLLDRMKLLRYDSTDLGEFLEAAVEFSRGNSESNTKSFRNADAWRRKRDAARLEGKPLTDRHPEWVEKRDGKWQLVQGRDLVMKLIFEKAAAGRGAARIVRELTGDGVPPFGQPLTEQDVEDWPARRASQPESRRKPVPTPAEKAALRRRVGELGHWHKGEWVASRWSRSYINLILQDRRALGEYQPRTIDGEPDGDPIPGHYPPAVTQEEWDAAETGRAGRRIKGKGSRCGKHADIFAGTVRAARDGDTYYAATRTDGDKHSRVLINTGSAEGRSKCWSFPLPAFEWAVLRLLREVDPRSVLPGGDSVSESQKLATERERIEAKLEEFYRELLEGGESATLIRVVRQLEDKKRKVVEAQRIAQRKESNPLSEAWGQTHGLLETIATAPDPADARLRLRSLLRRIVDSVWILPVPRGRARLCLVQLWFTDAEHHRNYLILHEPSKGNGKVRVDSLTRCWSLADVFKPGDVDLRTPEVAAVVAEKLLALDLEKLPPARFSNP